MKIKKNHIEFLIISTLSLVTYITAHKYDWFELIYQYSRKHEDLEVDELVVLFSIISIALLIFYILRWFEQNKLEYKQRKTITELENAITNIEMLEGLLPICASCKKIKDEKKKDWVNLEAYFNNRTNLSFTHGICPECTKKLYPELYDNVYPDDEKNLFK